MRHKASQLRGLLKERSIVGLFDDYVEWAINRGSANIAIGRLTPVIEILCMMEDSVVRSGSSLQDALLESQSAEDIRRAGIFSMFLSERGVLTTTAQGRKNISYARRIDSLLIKISQEPWAPDINAYYKRIQGKAPCLAVSTQFSYLRAATTLMEFSKVSCASELTDLRIRQFLLVEPGNRASITPWVSFINLHINGNLHLPSKRSFKKSKLSSLKAKVAKLYHAVESSESLQKKRACMAVLLATIYGAPFKDVAKLNRSDLSVCGNQCRLNLGGIWTDVEAPLSQHLMLLLTSTNSKAPTAKLFPGRLIIDGISATAAQHYINSK
jgi:hypothetical protein